MPQHTVEHIVAVFHEEGLTDAAPHNLGLAAYCKEPREYARALKRCQPDPTRLRVVTMGTDQAPGHDGTMTCPCQPCAIERSKLKAKGAGPAAFAVRSVRRAA